MDMILEGSCQCGRVSFTVDSVTAYPFMYCYCSICRKLSGGPFGCNIMGKRQTLRVRGKAHLRVYHAVVREKGKRAVRSPAERLFCGECGTHLYLLDDRWPEGVWPNAGAIDTPLPRPPEHVQIMTENKPAWVPDVKDGPSFKRYPKLSIADWHAQHGLVGKGEKSRQRRR